jgi:hypothetical protein
MRDVIRSTDRQISGNALPVLKKSGTAAVVLRRKVKVQVFGKSRRGDTSIYAACPHAACG